MSESKGVSLIDLTEYARGLYDLEEVVNVQMQSSRTRVSRTVFTCAICGETVRFPPHSREFNHYNYYYSGVWTYIPELDLSLCGEHSMILLVSSDNSISHYQYAHFTMDKTLVKAYSASHLVKFQSGKIEG